MSAFETVHAPLLSEAWQTLRALRDECGPETVRAFLALARDGRITASGITRIPAEKLRRSIVAEPYIRVAREAITKKSGAIWLVFLKFECSKDGSLRERTFGPVLPDPNSKPPRPF